MISDEAFEPSGGDALAGDKSNRCTRIQIPEILGAKASPRAYGSRRVLFEFHTADRSFIQSIPFSEAPTLVRTLERILGKRFTNCIPPYDFSSVAELASKKTLWKNVWSFASAVILLIGAWILGKTQDNEFAPLASVVMLNAGFVGVASVGGVLDNLPRVSRRKKGLKPFHSLGFCWILRLAGIALFLSPFFLDRYISHVQNGGNPDSNVDNGLFPQLAVFSVLSITISIGGVALVQLGHRLGLSGAEIHLESSITPILFLRSFGADGRGNLNPDGFAAAALGIRASVLFEKLGVLGNIHPIRALRLAVGCACDTSEEQLARFFRKLGPFVAVGRPGEVIATSGAERLYIEEDEWKCRIVELLQRSQVIVLQPGRSRGIWWEIETCVRTLPPEKLLFCLSGLENSAEAYDEFRARLEGIINRPLPRNIGNRRFICFDPNWNPQALSITYSSPLLWTFLGSAVDFPRTLWPFLSKRFASRFPQKPPPRTCLFHKPIAVSLFSVIPLLILSVGLSHTRQNQPQPLNKAAYETAGSERFAWTWELPAGWREMEVPAPSRSLLETMMGLKTPLGPEIHSFAVNGGSIVATVQARADQVHSESLERDYMESLAAISRSRPKVISRGVVTVGGHKWVQRKLVWKPRTKLRQNTIARYYSGPEGSYLLELSAPRIFSVVGYNDWGQLSSMADRFTLPPAPKATAKPADGSQEPSR
jgi:hypothetical protein